MLNRLAAALLLALLVAAGSSLDARAQAADANATLGTQGLSDDEVATIRQTIEAWTKDFAGDDFAGWEKYWTSDPVLAAPGVDRMVGKADITAYVKKTFAGRGSYTFSDWSVAGREDLAVVTNTITWEPTGGQSEALNQMIVLRREQSGDWRVQSVLYNTPS